MAQPLSYGLAGTAAYTGYYKHSGRVTLAGLAMTAGLGLPAAAVAGFAYAYADLFIPFVYARVALAIGFGVGMGALCGAALRWGNVRNVPVSLATIGVLTAAAYYVSWAAWICATLDHTYRVGRDFTVAELAARPAAVWELVTKINEIGTFSVGRASSRRAPAENANERGAMLTVIWLGEAAAVFGGAFYVGRKFAGDLPFCEACERWAAKPATITRLGVGDPARARADVEAGRYDYLASLLGGATPGRWWLVDYYQCHGCRRFHVVRVNDVTRTVDKNGRETDKATPVLPRFVVTAEQLRALKAGFGLGPATPVPVDLVPVAPDQSPTRPA